MTLRVTGVGDTKGRRQFLHDAAAAVTATASAAVLGSVAGCSTPRGAAPARSTTSTPAPLSTTTEPVDPAAWSQLAGTLDGSLVLPTSASYASATLVYNLPYTAVLPAAVAYCASASDVQRCVSFARAHGLPATPRSGGHSYAGYSTGPGLVIDVSRLNAVSPDTVSPDTGTGGGSGAGRGTIGAGTQLVDVYDRLSTAGLLLPAGSCPSVGIAGLTLGGGIGVVGRKYGLTCDNLLSLDTVTADGRLVTADAGQNADLFWASRGGGGGNFGIVTSFTFALHPIPELSLFTINWPWPAAADVLGAWQLWTSSAPDELWSNCQLQSAGSGGLNVRTNGVFVGTTAALTTVLRPFLAQAGPPRSQFVGSDPYLHTMLVEAGCEDLSVAQCHLTGGDTAGTLARSSFAATSAYVLSALSDAGMAACVGAVENLQAQLPELGGGIVFDAYGGVINTVAPADTAFVHRTALCAMQSSASWGPGAPAATVSAAKGWLQQSAAALAPFVSRFAYQNYIDPTLLDWPYAYYGTNLPRLVDVKRRYDPDDVFHFAQSIPTDLPVPPG
ncbi:MAG TPA: FAD-binding oxidoreductase [Acidimicrobiales bacterium]|nr:FAD-binding oxidoreductase [Acidimicrobiales bacterium]